MSDSSNIPEYVESSGNVFRDLGLPDAEELLVKAELARRISELLEDREITQAEAARLLGTQQTEVSQLLRGELSAFSIDHLIRFLNALGRDVQIVVDKQPAPGERGSLTVAA